MMERKYAEWILAMWSLLNLNILQTMRASNSRKPDFNVARTIETRLIDTMNLKAF